MEDGGDKMGRRYLSPEDCMRIGLAGVGRIGVFHAWTLKNLPAVTELVLADVDTERARETAADMEVQYVDQPLDLLDAGIDGFVITAATSAHAELIIAGVDAGITTFCEKPVAPDSAGTRAVLAKVHSSDVPVQIGFQRRFDAGYRAAKAAVESGQLGWLHSIRASTLDQAPPPASYISTSGGLFRDCNVHDFDIIRYVTGAEVESVYAVGSNLGASFFSDAGDVDTASALLTMSDGSLAQVIGTRYNGAGHDIRFELLGSKGSVAVGLDERTPLRSLEKNVSFPTGAPYTDFMDRFLNAYRAELGVFTQVVAGAAAVPCTVEDALEAFLIAEACEISRHEGRPVQIKEVR